ncbi:MAG TPA: class I SAM-dependent methyltransferase [Terriglobales bacterium]|jgi:ubiquinone/menaquinone biosynthesis C-methylase UbiE|nr:class I SAM-dependent methyltransferase [Terriglobales bacterium]
MGLIPEEIEAYYLHGKESERLSNEWGELERLRTQAILARHLPPAPAVILDVGGGAGAYAFPLAKQGYEVHLIDPVELHLEQARSHAEASGIRLASIRHGDARHLDFPASGANAVLLLGPLYHLAERSDRLQVLLEARRALGPGGVLFAASISRFASLIDGLSRGFFQDAEFRQIVEADLTHGLHRNSTNQFAYFTTAYFHRPEELAAEVSDAEFGDIRVLAIEGPAWSTALFRDAWNDAVQQQKLLEFLSLIEDEPSIKGASAHVMAVAFRPR